MTPGAAPAADAVPAARLHQPVGQWPTRWSQVLDAPAYLINLDSRPNRLAPSLDELRRAGFTDVRRFPAVDASDPAVLQTAWAAYGSPKFAEWDSYFSILLGKQGCFLSHVRLWDRIVAEGYPFACVFEDDVIFHRHWVRLAPTYFRFTPRDYDILFFGGEITETGSGLVRRAPAFCTHAYLITQDGAKRLRSILLDDPDGVATIDVSLHWRQRDEWYGGNRAPFDWYVWDGTTFPDAVGTANAVWRPRNTGLVFQDPDLGSDVDQR